MSRDRLCCAYVCACVRDRACLCSCASLGGAVCGEEEDRDVQAEDHGVQVVEVHDVLEEEVRDVLEVVVHDVLEEEVHDVLEEEVRDVLEVVVHDVLEEVAYDDQAGEAHDAFDVLYHPPLHRVCHASHLSSLMEVLCTLVGLCATLLYLLNVYQVHRKCQSIARSHLRATNRQLHLELERSHGRLL